MKATEPQYLQAVKIQTMRLKKLVAAEKLCMLQITLCHKLGHMEACGEWNIVRI